MSVTYSQEDYTISEIDLACFSDQRCREILAVLQQQETEIDRRTLAEQVAAAEQEVAPEEVTEQKIEEVLITLHHHHLPKLEDAGRITYDDQQKLVTRHTEGENTEALLTEL